MCVAIPGKVVSVDDGTADIDFGGNKMKAMAGLVTIAPGDYVLVHAGCIITKMKQQEAEELFDLLQEQSDEA